MTCCHTVLKLCSLLVEKKPLASKMKHSAVFDEGVCSASMNKFLTNCETLSSRIEEFKLFCAD